MNDQNKEVRLQRPDTNHSLEYQVLITPAEEGGFVVSVPALPGCVTQGETYDEAVAMARDCIKGFLACLADAGEPIPVEPTPHEELRDAL